jgi:hypothetical protein
MGFPSEWLNRPRKKNTPETHLRRQALLYLRSRGHFAGKVNVIGTPLKNGGFISSPDLMRGLPDIFSFAIKDSVMVMYGIELKCGKNKLTSHQETFKAHFHYPPYRIYLEIHSLEELEKIIS